MSETNSKFRRTSLLPYFCTPLSQYIYTRQRRIYVLCHICHADYYMSGNKLDIVDEEKDLGVIVSKDLKWDKQCSQAVKKAWGNKKKFYR